MSKINTKHVSNVALHPDQAKNDELTLSALFTVIWKGKVLVTLITALFALTSIIYALNVPEEYRSSAILAPATSSGSSSLSRLAGQFGGLASFAGVNLGGGDSVDKTTIALELMNTWGFLESFIRENDLEVEVYAVIGWDKEANQLILDESLYDLERKEWKETLEGSKRFSEKPSSWKLYKEIKQRISASRDTKTGLISISVEHFSPHVAKKWVDQLVLAINHHMQEHDRQDALNSIEYLKSQIHKTDVSEMRAIFYQLIEEQTKTLMLAEVSEEYVFKTLSSAKVAEERFKPKRALLVILGTMLGGILSVFVVLIRHYTGKNATFNEKY